MHTHHQELKIPNILWQFKDNLWLQNIPATPTTPAVTPTAVFQSLDILLFELEKKKQEKSFIFLLFIFKSKFDQLWHIKTKKPELAFFRSMILNLGLLLYVLSKKYLSKYNTENIQVSGCSWEFFPKYFFSSFSKVSWLTF